MQAPAAPFTLQKFMRSSLLAVGSMSVFGLMGCGIAQAPDSADAEAQTTAAIVMVEHGNQGDAVVARFVRTKQGAVDEPALRLAGVPEIPSPTKGCVAPSEAPILYGARQVDLLNVGAITVDGERQKTSLYAREMPDPAGVVSGVFYSARTNEALTGIHVAGSPDLGAFDVTVPAPHELGEVSIASMPAGLDVSWEASGEGDVVYLDVISSSRVLARCSAIDTGHFTVPFASLGTIADGEIALHRIHVEPFTAKGASPAEVRFDVSRVTPFRR